MTKHVAERDRSAKGLGDHVIAFARDPDPVVLPGRHIAADGIIQLEVALFVKAHQRDRSDRLGHRIDAIDGVVAGGLAALNIHQAERLGIGQMAMSRDADLTPGQLARRDIVAL